MTCRCNARQPRPLGLAGGLTHFLYGQIFADDGWWLYMNHLPPE